jgi:hypothetical protein
VGGGGAVEFFFRGIERRGGQKERTVAVVSRFLKQFSFFFFEGFCIFVKQ